MTIVDYDKLKSTPHDPLGTTRIAMRSIRPEVPTRDLEDDSTNHGGP